MSTYLDIKLKKKGLSVDNAPTVLTLCNTPARELADEISFKWGAEVKNDEYRYWTVLTLDKLHEIQSFYSQRVSDLEKSYFEREKERAQYIEMLPKATSKDNFERIGDKINEIKNHLNWLKKEKETATYFLYDFNHLESLLNDNTAFELVYYIG